MLLLPFTEPAARQIVRISIDDENDNPPHFKQLLFSGGMEHPGSNLFNLIIKFIFKKYSSHQGELQVNERAFCGTCKKKDFTTVILIHSAMHFDIFILNI